MIILRTALYNVDPRVETLPFIVAKTRDLTPRSL